MRIDASRVTTPGRLEEISGSRTKSSEDGFVATLTASAKFRSWTMLLSIPLAALLLYLALRGIEWDQVWNAASSARPAYLGLSCLIATISCFLRSLRWRVLLNAGGRLPVATVFWATMAGYLGNNTLPARAGELVRTVMISARSGLSKTYVLTTAMVERSVDAIVLVAVGFTTLGLLEKGPDWFTRSSRGMALAAVAALAALIVLPRMTRFLGSVVHALPLPAALCERLVNMVDQLVLGIRTLHHPGRLSSFSVFTVVIWLLDAVGSVIVARAFGLHLSIPVALLLLAGLGLGSALPSTPGYIGIYQFVAVTVLTPFGFSRSDALAYILVAQFLLFLVVGFWGLIGLWRYRSARMAAHGQVPGTPST
jgi:uncharacterized protein (TIRG00374 family)